jgi:NAD(P)H-dependent FMN reductase
MIAPMTNPNSASPPPRVLAVVGSLSRVSAVRVALEVVAEELRKEGCAVDLVDFGEETLPLFNPETSHLSLPYASLKERVDRADVYLLGTPDYHGSMSGATKNFLDHFWREFGGKLFATLVSSYDKGLTVADQIRTVARQCYAWSMPYSVSFSDREEMRDPAVAGEALRVRLGMFARDIRVYGRLLAEQRRVDLAGADPGFMARWRKEEV